MTFRYCSSPIFAGINDLNAPPVPPEINRSKKAGGPATYDKTIQHVAANPFLHGRYRRYVRRFFEHARLIVLENLSVLPRGAAPSLRAMYVSLAVRAPSSSSTHPFRLMTF